MGKGTETRGKCLWIGGGTEAAGGRASSEGAGSWHYSAARTYGGSCTFHFLGFFFEAPKNDIIDFMPFLSTFASFLAACDVGALLTFCRSPRACNAGMRVVVRG